MNEIKEQSKAYTTGALIGGIVAATTALILKKRVILWSVIGVVVGGFISHRIYKSGKETSKTNTNFKNYDLD